MKSLSVSNRLLLALLTLSACAADFQEPDVVFEDEVRLPLRAHPALEVSARASEEGTERTTEGRDDVDASFVTAWTDLAREQVFARKLSPPVASRLYAYVGLALYEAMRLDAHDLVSLSESLDGFEVPRPPSQPVDPAAVMAEATRGVLMNVLEDDGDELIRDLHRSQLARRRAVTSRSVHTRSIRYGRLLARAVSVRASRDGFHERNAVAYRLEESPSAWRPTAGGSPHPLEPGWGTLKPFALRRADECDVEPHARFSSSSDSTFYAEAYAVYETARTLTEEQKTIARFWADLPGQSATPPGHWLALAGQILRDRSEAPSRTAEVIARTSLAMADAFIASWHTKYRTNLLRPETYIQRYIDPEFVPFLVTPSFPEYTSGHSTTSGAAAEVLTGQLGHRWFVDRTAEGFEPRGFSSFWEAANEAAASRLYGGIHYPMGNIDGLAQGKCVGQLASTRLVTRRP